MSDLEKKIEEVLASYVPKLQWKQLDTVRTTAVNKALADIENIKAQIVNLTKPEVDMSSYVPKLQWKQLDTIRAAQYRQIELKIEELETRINNIGSWVSKTIRIGHTFTIYGEIKVPSGNTDYICPFFLDLPTGQTAKLVTCRYLINSGVSVVFKLQVNDSDIAGFTGLSATMVAEANPADVTLVDGDKIALVVTAVSGAPENLSVTVFIDYTV